MLVSLSHAVVWPHELFLYTGVAKSPAKDNLVMDVNMGGIYYPISDYPMQVGIGVGHAEVNFIEEEQVVTDETVLELVGWLYHLGIFICSIGDYDANAALELGFYVGAVLNFVWNGYLYFPIDHEGLFGIVNKHKFVTQVITKGFVDEAFTFQDDLGVRFNITAVKMMQRRRPFWGDDYVHPYVDLGVRFNKNFADELKGSIFVQIGM
ncbi:MAG: hypothetical protein HUK19_01160 [Fibrobacter sp.]|nr:hypothetical protein [Fibrobacter sp.]